jgi:hypothetical protein
VVLTSGRVRQAITFAQDQHKSLEKVAREGSENLQTSMRGMSMGFGGEKKEAAK